MSALGVAALITPLAGPLRAATVIWQGGDATAPQWSQAGNWNGGEPTAADDATFPSPVPATPGATISLGVGEVANSLSFSDNYTLGATAGAGDLTLTSGNVTVDTGVTATIAAQLKGTTGLTLNGLGTVALTNTTAATTNNTFTGGINLNAGTLQFSVDAALGAVTGNNLNFNGGTLNFNGASATAVTLTGTRILNIGAGGGTFALTGSTGTTGKVVITTANQITGSGTFTKTGASDLQITAAQSLTGTFRVNGLIEASVAGALGTGGVEVNANGELALGAANLANSITLNGGIVSSINAAATLSGAVNVAGPTTVRLSAFNTTTNSFNLTVTGALSGAGNLTTVSSNSTGPTFAGAHIFLTADNTNYTGALSVGAGTSADFATVNSRGTYNLTVASTATALGGVGVGYVPANQASLPTINTDNTGTNGGVFSINTTGFNTALDLNTLYSTGGGKWFLGSGSAGTYTADTLGVSSDGNYRLGGGGGTLTFAPTTSTVALLSGANNLVVGTTARLGNGNVVLGGENTFTGNVAVVNGGLSVASVNSTGDTSSGIGLATTAVVLGSGTTSSAFTFTGATDTTARDFTLAGTGGSTITVSTDNATLTVGRLNGTATTPLTKSGFGSLTSITTAAHAFGAVTVNGDNIATSGVGSLGDAAATATRLTLGSGGTTISGDLQIGNSGNAASLAVTGGAFSASGTNLNLGTRTAVSTNQSVGVLDLSAATGVTLTYPTMRLAVDFGATAANGQMRGTITLPTVGTAVNTLTATTSVTLGNSPLEGSPTGTLNLGGGATTISTPTLLIGGVKSNGVITFNGSSTSKTLTLRNGASGRTTLTIGNNSVSTGTPTVSSLSAAGRRLTALLGR